jgi:hypothetical protein
MKENSIFVVKNLRGPLSQGIEQLLMGAEG